MKIQVITTLLFCFSLLAQEDHIQVWQGIMVQDGKRLADAQVLWLKIPKDEASLSPAGEYFSRQESTNTEFYALHKLTVKYSDGFTILDEAKSYQKKLNRGVAFCRMTYKLKYNESNGYFEGSYVSSDCRNTSGKLYLYKSEHPIATGETMTLTHAWVRKLIDAIEQGKPSPAKMV